MNGRSSFTTSLLVAVVTAGTYLFMHFVVSPHLPVIDAEVPSVSGLQPEQARALLGARGLLLTLDGESPDDKVAPGTLTQQVPLGGSRVRRGAEVHAFVAKAPSVPAVVGLPLADAQTTLARAHLRADRVTEAPSDTVAKGVVLAQTPGPGQQAAAGAVDLQVSAGASAEPVPALVGKRLSKAKEMLQAAGFVVGGTRYGSNDDYEQGIVIKQSPDAGQAAPKGAKVDLVIND